MVFYICVGAVIGLIIGRILFAVNDSAETFGTIETNIENGQTLFRFIYEKDPKNMINHRRVIFRIRMNKDLHSLKDIGNGDSQNKLNT